MSGLRRVRGRAAFVVMNGQTRPGSSCQRAGIRSAVIAAGAIALLLSTIGIATAEVGPTNNFGTLKGSDDKRSIRLGDSRIQEYALWPDFMVHHWTASQINFFRGMIYAAVENTFEPSDLTVTLAADSTVQDVIFVPVPVNTPEWPNALASTYCHDDANFYGSHHHRVCDRHLVAIYQNFWDAGLNGDQMVYNVLAHEFGHAVGLRHSDSPCADLRESCVGTSAAGDPQWNTMPFTKVPSGSQSLMFSMALIATPSLTLYEYADLNLHY